jgi:hypothetical protein
MENSCKIDHKLRAFVGKITDNPPTNFPLVPIYGFVEM